MAARIKTVCLIHSHLGPALTHLGVRATRLDPPRGTASLPELLAGLPEPPDCVIHQENLGARLVLTDLAKTPCPVVYWALDPHLNFFWQRHYARGFSAVATTQPHLAKAFAAAGAPHAAWVPWHGAPRPFVPHADRAMPLAFVGRVTPQRRRRQWFAEHMARYGLVMRDDVHGEAMAAFYDAARIVPNESIAGEINLRLFEAASSGCLPVAERRPEGVDTLFVPEREAFYYDDVLELDDRLRFALTHPDLTEKMGRAAHAAVAARHLPLHRAAALLELAGRCAAPPRGPEAATAEALALYHLRRSGQLALAGSMIWQRLAAVPDTPEVMAARIQTVLGAGDRNAVLALIGFCLARPALSGHPLTATACCLAACRLDAPGEARLAYVAQAGHGRRDIPRLSGPRDYLLHFAGALEAAGYEAAPGMVFDPTRHLPENAVQCLVAAKALAPDDLEIDRRLDRLLARLPGSEPERVALMSNLTLHRPDDWSLGLTLGLADLAAFRLGPGLEEVVLAAATAVKTGQEKRFARRLALADPSGRLRAVLRSVTDAAPAAAQEK
ncbi:conserved hypothetical protein [Solidesulfovibrio fructosivorans JJ]]|uniref:Spore protein YkvP/CgeB glycosyl transferase-like domain-containing protein n=1 Tax=Solidesulfovibrio fructosivorans JJ] TaxID=596151 RepID=E1JXI9_SOLFR|nr:glycosyltransferase [Solidesulfovibrio fructosivorans]EFL50966.1 conserved hypothetical protein [Solidesulfovibrio fructosivorans JJ]]